MTRLLDGLERAGYVEKATCPSDLRVMYAALTESGRKKLEEASRSHVGAICELFEERFSEKELAALTDLLGRLLGDASADACVATD